MSIANLNVRVDRSIKEQSEAVFENLGINMTSAINMFLRQTIREQGLPFTPSLHALNATTLSAIDEGRIIARDKNVKGYESIEELKKALDEWSMK